MNTDEHGYGKPREPANSVPDIAQRMECVRLAGAFAGEGLSKGRGAAEQKREQAPALHTLRDIGRARKFRAR